MSVNAQRFRGSYWLAKEEIKKKEKELGKENLTFRGIMSNWEAIAFRGKSRLFESYP